MSGSAKHAAAIRSVYRELLFMAKNIKSETERTKALHELRTSFRAAAAVELGNNNNTADTIIEERLAKAQSRASFLRMTLPKSQQRRRQDASTAGTFVYKDGKPLQNVNGTLRDDKGRVHTNWDGKNLDPDSVKRHRHGLRRAGFVNNLHAKGFF